MQVKQYCFLNKMTVDNTYIPGSVWLYYKLYTGPKLADKILALYILPIINQLYEHRLIDLFFFIRYNDPDFHIRIRFKTKNNSDVISIITPIWTQLVKEQKINKVVIDSYIQETGRYENINMEVIESIFSIDSYACLQMFNYLQLTGKDQSNMRWLLSIKMIDRLLNALKYNDQQKSSLINSLAENFRREFLFTTHNYTKQINRKYRSYYLDVEMMLKNHCGDSQIEEIVDKCTDQLLPLFCQLQLNSNNTERIIGSIIHMFMNRWFRSQNRLYEMVIYSFMGKYYKQKIYQFK
ncbi:MAG: thiopeptide-type bacteriocin biosynthesis protein [Lachnospiraceae bacterium]|nr:thiopeptide-type bacteriocin biosynthesis protein [Lachnospiraceae bacterium]